MLPTNRRTDRPTDTARCRVACPWLKTLCASPSLGDDQIGISKNTIFCPRMSCVRVYVGLKGCSEEGCMPIPSYPPDCDDAVTPRYFFSDVRMPWTLSIRSTTLLNYSRFAFAIFAQSPFTISLELQWQSLCQLFTGNCNAWKKKTSSSIHYPCLKNCYVLKPPCPHNSIVRCIIDGCRTLCVWVVNLFIFYVIERSMDPNARPTFGEEFDTSYGFLQVWSLKYHQSRFLWISQMNQIFIF